MMQLRGYILLVEKALQAQDLAAQRILNISNNFQEKIDGTKTKLNNISTQAKAGGGRKKKSRRRRRRTKKRPLKQRHRRKSRRRKRRKSRR